jgi:drug/metabolite transporter (DMT)-like permease
MMVAGIGLLSLDGEGGGLNIGDFLTLISGALFAGHIIAVDRCQKKTDTYALIVLQFAFCAVYAFVYYLLFERHLPLSFTMGSIGGLLYLAVFSTTIAMSLQNIGQSMAPSSHAAILLSLESVFGALASWVVLGEVLTSTMLLGFAIIFGALVVNSVRTK